MNESPLAVILGAISEIKGEEKYSDTSFLPAIERLKAQAINEFVGHLKETVPNARPEHLTFMMVLLTQLATNRMGDRSLELVRRSAIEALKLTAIEDAPLDNALSIMERVRAYKEQERSVANPAPKAKLDLNKLDLAPDS